jgi:adenosylmethionine-8-amino-7-oxononanoate aminotransferase
MKTLAQRDSQVIWHPYTQMQTADLPIAITKAEGAYLYDEQGNAYLDAIASWWTNTHGHAHPHIAKALSEQAQTLEHCIFAGFTHSPAVELAERLLAKLPKNQKRVFYSDNGSTAVEVALKMTFQFHHNRGEARKRVLAFENAYHGDTFGAMAVGERSPFSAPFHPFLFEVEFLPLPTQENWANIEKVLIQKLQTKEIASFIFEPLVQGTAGMLMYEPVLLDKMIQLCHEYGTLCIADEVMTGFGRTGKLFAIEHLHEQIDLVCLSKGLTGGFMALGVTTCTQAIYEAFLSEDRYKTFFHGHSYTGNALACRVAVASLDLIDLPAFTENLERINTQHTQFAQHIAQHERVRQVRHLGTIIAVEIESGNTSYFNNLRDRLYHFFLSKYILLRPLGNVVYILPPYCISDHDLQRCYEAMEEFLDTK